MRSRPAGAVERDRLIEQYLPLVRHVVARLNVAVPAGMTRDDFLSAGVVGLVHAAASYDADRGASFKTFAFTAIRGAVLDEIRRHDPLPRGRRARLRQIERARAELTAAGRAPTHDELAERLGIDADTLDQDLLAVQAMRVLSLDDRVGADEESSLSGNLSDSRSDGPVDLVEREELRDLLARELRALPAVERKVMLLYHFEELYLREIGALIGVTESRVSQILARATERLRQRLQRA